MRRQLTLLRHAKSSWDDARLKDRNRPLNDRGERDAPVMGQRLRARGARPTLIITSPAVRARRTAQIIAREIGFPQEFLQLIRDHGKFGMVGWYNGFRFDAPMEKATRASRPVTLIRRK